MNPEDVIAKLARPLSVRRRFAYLAAFLGGLGGASVVGLLWTTEPGLPSRTEFMFGVLVLIGLSWAVIGAWALTRRTPLYALDRVISGWVALTAAGLFAVAALVITVLRHRVEPALLATVVVFVAVAVVNLVRASAHRADLLRRKRELGG